MYDLVEGIKHPDSGKIIVKHVKKLPLFLIFSFTLTALARYLMGKDDLVVLNAEAIGAYAVLLIVWLRELLVDICSLSEKTEN
ncbi:hypothetical protein KCM76_24405 [Zooshikella marina]|uniref:hypothetical protein n=1 Tax=Zooshikella ganghwensis TaxID=202772 RepID=UPI001BAE985E|nr:hypothetical protein [Zooshikella ganghwensis]MBU2709160.1 hypothetical protein [Zooshikella ganghwensis]